VSWSNTLSAMSATLPPIFSMFLVFSTMEQYPELTSMIGVMSESSPNGGSSPKSLDKSNSSHPRLFLDG